MAFTEYITNAFLTLLNDSVTGGGPVNITSVQVGSGYPAGSDNPQNFTGLKNRVQTLGSVTSPSTASGITSINDSVLYQSTVRFQVSSADAPLTYQFNEYGIWASVGANAPVMIVYATIGTPSGDTITPSGTGTPVIRQKATIIPYSQQATTTTSLTLVNTVDLHAATHLDNGTDPIPVSTVARTGSLPQLSGRASDVLCGDAVWRAGFLSGMMLPYAGPTPPTGWLLCDGSAVNRVTYSALYGVIGTAYGTGDGSTSFNLPDLRGRAPLGAGSGPGLTTRTLGSKGGEETHPLTIAELAVHNHGIADGGHSHNVTQTPHIHGISDPQHSHSIYDPSRAHGVYDPQHQHVLICYQAGGGGGNLPVVYNPPGGSQQATNLSPTGVGIYASGTGVGTYNANTGISVQGGNASVTVASAATGISTVNQGSGAAHNTMMPWTAINWIVKA